jgi:hypothetical protein
MDPHTINSVTTQTVPTGDRVGWVISVFIVGRSSGTAVVPVGRLLRPRRDALLQAADGDRRGDRGVDLALPRMSSPSHRGGFWFR